MKLSELLAYTAAEYLDDRTELYEGSTDELWSNKTITRYLNEAQNILCRRSWVLIDTGNLTAGSITLRTDKATYALHKSVLRVFTATPTDTDIPLGRTTDDRLTYLTATPTDPQHWGEAYPYAAATGRPTMFATDAGSRLLRVYRTPSSVENGLKLLLKVARLPCEPLSTTLMEDSPEIPEEWHLSLCTYAAGRCLRHPTADSAQKTLGRELMSEFLTNVQEARQERERQEMAPERPAFASTTAFA